MGNHGHPGGRGGFGLVAALALTAAGLTAALLGRRPSAAALAGLLAAGAAGWGRARRGRHGSDAAAWVPPLLERLEARGRALRGHAERVARYSRALASQMGLDAAAAEEVACAALLHDIGKVGVPEELLAKPGSLDAAERAQLMAHAALGADLLAGAGPLARLAPLVRHHHEWYNGEGYPDGLRRDRIPLGSCIIAVADALDAMTTDRPYRAGCGRAQALAEIRRGAGTQFHPRVVAAALTALRAPVALGIVPVPRVAPTLAEQGR